MQNPKLILGLYEQMKQNPNLSGSYKLVDNSLIEWKLFDGFSVQLAEDYIGIERLLFGKIPDAFIHWHPQDDEIYEDVCAIGEKGNVTVVKKDLFGDSLLYAGKAENCPNKRKRFFGRYYYLYAK